MKIVISENQFQKFLLEQTGYEFQLDKTFADPKQAQKHNTQLRDVVSTMSKDDIVDVISAAIDGIPGIGNIVSAGIDLTHVLTYIVRGFFSKNEDEKAELLLLALITLGATFIPVAGNSLPIMVRTGLKTFSKKTPQEILILAKKLGIYKKSVVLLSKTKWKYNILLTLAKIFGSELSEVLSKIKQPIQNLINKIKLPKVTDALQSIESLIDELISFSDIAIVLSKNIEGTPVLKMEGELDEQETADAGTTASATPTSTTSQNAGVSKGYPKVTKWDDRTNATKRGKANPLGKSGEKWSTNLVRGVANNLF